MIGVRRTAIAIAKTVNRREAPARGRMRICQQFEWETSTECFADSKILLFIGLLERFSAQLLFRCSVSEPGPHQDHNTTIHTLFWVLGEHTPQPRCKVLFIVAVLLCYTHLRNLFPWYTSPRICQHLLSL